MSREVAFIHEEDIGSEIEVLVESFDVPTQAWVPQDLSSATELGLVLVRNGKDVNGDPFPDLTIVETSPGVGATFLKFRTDGTDGLMFYTTVTDDVPAGSAGHWRGQPRVKLSAALEWVGREFRFNVYEKR